MLGMSVSAAPAMREFGVLPSARVSYIPLVDGNLAVYGMPNYSFFAGYDNASVLNTTMISLCDRAVATAMEAFYAEQSGDASVLNLLCNYDSPLANPVRGIDYYLYNLSSDANYDALLTNRILTNYYVDVIVRPEIAPTSDVGVIDVLLQTTDGGYVVYSVAFNKEADGSFTTHMCGYMAAEDPASDYV